ncbi:Oligo alginate lyase [Minicystis rosea]|nr:Oligo alginate lyase [Minicystis rosea]
MAGPMKPQLEVLVRHADAHLGDTPPSALPTEEEPRGDLMQNSFLANTLVYSFLGLVTDSPRYREAGKRWALALAGMRDWGGTLDPRGKCTSCSYPEGWGVTALAVAYDFLYHHYSDDERARIRDKIGAVCRGLFGGVDAGEWWTGAYLHHDTWIPIGGLGVGAMAVIDELVEAPVWAERARGALNEALNWLDGDGAWPEGPCGWAFAMVSAIPFWDAFRRRFPSRAASFLGHPWLQRTAGFRIHSRLPDGRFLGFGDCQPHGGYQQNARQAAPTLRWLAARYRNVFAQWQAAREWEKAPNPYTAVWEIVWMDPDVREAPVRDLPVGALFDNQEMAYLRTGWDMDATVIAFRSDSLIGRRAASMVQPGNEAPFNNSATHVHADANGFAVWARGELAVVMPRYGQNRSEFSNTLLVNGQGQLTRFSPQYPGRPDGEVTAFFASRAASLVAGEAAKTYAPGLQRYARRLLLVDPGVLFVSDDVVADAPVDFTWRFHVHADAALDVGHDGFTSVLNGRTTTLRVASPRDPRMARSSDDWNHAISVSPRERTDRATFGAVVVPSLPAGSGARIETPGEAAFVVEALGATVLAAFAHRNGPAQIPGRLTSDGTVAAVSRSPAATSFFAAEATELGVDGEAWLLSSSPVTISYRREGGEGRVTIAARAPTQVTIVAGMRVRGARTAEGGPVAFTAGGVRVLLRVGAGTSRIVLMGSQSAF